MHSGYTFRSRAIVEQQRARGWETCHVTSIKHNTSTQSDEVVDGLKFYRTINKKGLLDRIPIVNQWKVVSSLKTRLNQVIALEKPDILHAHSPALNGIAAIMAGKKHGIPVLYECRAFWEDAAVDHGTSSEGGIRYRLTRMLESYVFKHADAITTICEGLRGDIIQRGIPEEKVSVIPNAVDIDKFSISNTKNHVLLQKHNLENTTVLGFIGSFYAYEGLALLIQSMPAIINELPKTRLLLVGGGPQEESLKALVKSMELEAVILFTGRVPHSEVSDYYSLVDIFVYPRLSMRLTDLVTPLKPLEAMAQGKMVLASDVGGHKELIENGLNGRLFEAGSINSLVKATVDMVNNENQWDGYRQAGRAFVESERNWLKSVSNYEAVFSRLMDM